MIVISDTEVKNNPEFYMDKVIDDGEIIIITSENGKDVMMLPEEVYSNMRSSIHSIDSLSCQKPIMQNESIKKRIGVAEGKFKVPDEAEFDSLDKDLEEVFEEKL